MNGTTTQNCRRRTPSTYHYTKEQVQEFLGSKSNDINSLRQALKRRDFTVKTKQGSFILDKPMLCPIQQEFGFKPLRPNTTRILIQVLADLGGTTTMNWTELNNYIKEHYDKSPGGSNLSAAYRELVEYGTATDITSVELFDKSTGELATEEQIKQFRRMFYTMMGQSYPVGIAYNLALVNCKLKRSRVKEVGAY